MGLRLLFTASFHGLYLSYLIVVAVLCRQINVQQTEAHLDNGSKSWAQLTIWNFTTQIIYLILTVIIDIQDLCDFDLFFISKKKLRIGQGYLLNAIVAPYSMFVAYMFWSLYWYDKNLVVPPSLEIVVPPLLNHCLHTFILIPLLFELLFNRVYMPSHKSAIIGYTLYQLIYWGVLLFCVFYHGIWIYKVFAVLPLVPRICYICFNYLTGLFQYYIYNCLQKWRWSLEDENKRRDTDEMGTIEYCPAETKEFSCKDRR